MTLQGIDIIEDFLPLDLGSTDIILGVQWLETLGTTHINWKTHTMKFMVNNTSVTLQGDPALHKTLVSLKAMMRAIRCEGHGLMVELGTLGVLNQNNSSILVVVQNILQ